MGSHDRRQPARSALRNRSGAPAHEGPEVGPHRHNRVRRRSQGLPGVGCLLRNQVRRARTIISPGAVTTELLDHISEGDVQTANRAYVGKIGVPAATYARMVAFAIGEPADVDANEIVFRPTAQEL